MNQILGPLAWENWHAALRGDSEGHTYEAILYSDGEYVADLTTGLGPYSVLNLVPTISGPAVVGWIRPALMLRVTQFGDWGTMRPGWVEGETAESPKVGTDASVYHGGTSDEEIASLLSLLLGARIKAGGMTRRFDAGGDPRGLPLSELGPQPPPLVRADAPVIPRLCSRFDLRKAGPLSSYPDLTATQAITLLRAARSYQDALWLADTQPHIAWLLLVTAVEVAASLGAQDVDALVLLREERPDLAESMKGCDEDSIEAVARRLKREMAAGRRFRKFLLAHWPQPPDARPSAHAQFPWEYPNEVERRLKTVYDIRSRALHDAIPWPQPLCEPPMREGARGPLFEVPPGLGSAARSGVWSKDDLPAYLHVFEHIVRRALLSWWQAMASSE